MTQWGRTHETCDAHEDQSTALWDWLAWGYLVATVLYAFSIHLWVEASIGAAACVMLYGEMKYGRYRS